MRSQVRIHYSVAEEILSGGGAFRTVVPAICPVFASLVVSLGESLVDPVPDESSLEVLICVDRVPLEVEGAVGVAHGVGIFRWHYRLVLVVFAHLAEPCGARVLRDEHVGVPFPYRPFIAHRAVLPGGFESFELLVCIVEVHSVPGLVTEGEYRNARIGGGTAVHVHDPVDVLGVPLFLVAESPVQLVAHTV